MPTPHTPLLHHSALVTGGSSGIGTGIVRAFAAAGARVAVNYRSSKDEAHAIADEITKAGGEAIAIGGDVSKEDEVQRLFDEAVRAFGRLDIVVANSGIQEDAKAAEMTIDQWRKVIDTNLTGQFLCCRAAIRQFMTQERRTDLSRARGSILCMSSVHDVIPWAGHVNYAASKGGISLLMKSLAQEVAGDGIRVNAISPGAIKTAINADAWNSEEARQKLLKLIPYGRIGEVDDVARAAVWLSSDDADYVTGTTLYVDGGMTLYPGFEDNG